MQTKYKRVLLKLSGEALAGEKKFGLDYEVITEICKSIKEAAELGTEIAIVVGGGNFWLRPLKRFHGPYPGRPYWYARHYDERAGSCRRTGKYGGCCACPDCNCHAGCCRALYPQPRHPSPGEGTRCDFRLRNRKSVFLHRYCFCASRR